MFNVVPSVYDPSLAPAGKQCAIIGTICTPDPETQDNEAWWSKLEEMVVDGRIVQGQPFALSPSGPELAHPTEANQTIKTIDRLVIGTREVKFTELAALLTEMSLLAMTISDFLPDNCQAPGPTRIA